MTLSQTKIIQKIGAKKYTPWGYKKPMGTGVWRLGGLQYLHTSTSVQKSIA